MENGLESTEKGKLVGTEKKGVGDALGSRDQGKRDPGAKKG